MSVATLFEGLVVFDYEALEQSELTVKKGQVVSVKEQNNAGWSLVKVDGKSGWIPTDYLDPLDPKIVPPAEKVALGAPIPEQTTSAAGTADEAANALKQLSVGAGSSEACAKCSNAIADRRVVAKGASYHVQCFVCATCSKSLAGQPYIEKEKDQYCEDCYYRKFNPPCGRCNDVIKGKYVTALGQSWHPDCFVCNECDKPFTGTSFRKHAGESGKEMAFCENCYNQLHGSSCSKCNKIIESQAFEALGKKFHLECFTCKNGCAIGQDSHFHMYEEDIFCPKCFEAMFLQKCSSCQKVIEAQYVKVLENHFHPECWKCGNCSKVLDKDNCDTYGGKFFCLDCHIKVAVAGSASSTAPAATAAAPAATSVETKSDSKQQKPQASFAAQVAEHARRVSNHSRVGTTHIGPSKSAPKLESKQDQVTVEDVAGQSYYPLAALTKVPPPSGIDVSKKEEYLAPDVFEKIFGMTKESFVALKDWKKKALKQKHNLW